MSEEENGGLEHISQLLDDENLENITLVDENGDEVEMEQIAIITHNKEMYAILRPLDEDEDAAVVFKIDADDEESLVLVDDDKLADEIIAIYNKEIE